MDDVQAKPQKRSRAIACDVDSLVRLVCRMFGEKGYCLRDPADAWIKRKYTHLVMPPSWPNRLVLIGVRGHGVVLRPYSKEDIVFNQVFDRIKNSRSRPLKVKLRCGAELPAITGNHDIDWRFYYPRELWNQLGVDTDIYPEVVKPRSKK